MFVRNVCDPAKRGSYRLQRDPPRLLLLTITGNAPKALNASCGWGNGNLGEVTRFRGSNGTLRGDFGTDAFLYVTKNIFRFFEDYACVPAPCGT